MVQQDSDLPGLIWEPGGHGNPLQHSCLENTMDREVWRVIVCGVAKSQTQLKRISRHACSYHYTVFADGYKTCSKYLYFICKYIFDYCGVGEDSWGSLGLQGDQISPSWRKLVLNIHWKDWCWSWNSNTLATWCDELTHWEDPDAGKDWSQEEKGMTEDEMVGRHNQLDEHEFE